MQLSTKKWAALGLAIVLWTGETWMLVDAAGYTITPQVFIIPPATAALAFLPLILAEAGVAVGTAVLAASLFLAAFVFQAVLERTATPLDTKIAVANGVTEGRRLLEAELGKVQARLADAEAEVKRESRKGGCKWTCQQWQATVRGHQARIDSLLSEIQTQAPPPVADPVSKRFADMTGNVVSEDTIRNWRPAFQPVGFLVAIWALFGFALRETGATVTKAPATVTGNSETPSGGGGRGIRLVSGLKIEDRELKALKKALTGQDALTNDELADLMGVTKAEASRRATKAAEAGIVTRNRVGRHVAIRLAHAH